MLVAGCTTHGLSIATDEASPRAVELEAVPFFPQEDHQCGPAALATVLNWSGLEVTPQELTDKVYLPGRRGSLQAELMAATRGYGRVPYTVSPEVSAVLAEVTAQRPVLVLLNLGTGLLPVWHYAVVVGYSRTADEVVLRSGARKRAVLSASKFLRAWERGEFWGMVVLRPGELPAADDAEGYLAAVATLESLEGCDVAADCYRAAVDRWRRSPTAWFGLGNCRYEAGNLTASERFYRRVLELQPRHAAALNNLAQVLAEQGRCREARQTIEAALAVVDARSGLLPAITETSEGIRRCGH